MNRIISLVRRSPLVSFFALAYGLSWGVSLLLRGEPTGAFSPLFAGGPLVAAVLIVSMTDGRVGLRDLLNRLLRWQVAPGWYALVFGLPVAIVGSAIGLNTLFGGTAPDWTKAPGLTQLLLFMAIFLVVPIAAPLGEEVGWRGFALPSLLASRSALVATLILGVLWAAWHLPVVLANPSVRPPAPFLLAVPALAVLVTWLFLHTRESVFVALLFHAWYDLVLVFVLAVLVPADGERFLWAVAAVQWLAAAVVVVSARERWFVGPQAPFAQLRTAPHASPA